MQKGRVFGAYAFSLTGVLLALALPWPLKYLIDDVLQGQATHEILKVLTPVEQVALLACSMLVLASLAAIVLSMDKLQHARVVEHFSYKLRDDLVQQLHRLSRCSRQAERAGELSMRLTSDAHQVSRLFCKTTPMAAKHLLMSVAALVSIALINTMMGLIALVMATAFTLLVRHYGPALSNAATRRRVLEGQVAGITQETINAIEHVQAMALEQRSRSLYLRDAASSLRAGVEEVRVAVSLERSSQLMAGFTLALVAGVGGVAVVGGQLSLGTLTVCLAYVAQLLKPIEKINDIASSMSRGLVRAEQLEDLFRTETTSMFASGRLDPGRILSLECRNLGYCYAESQRSTISGFNHVFRQGECTALIGSSGSGKSTLLRLLLRLQAPTEGTLSVNGFDYNDVDSTLLRSQFAVLLQDPHLFAGTVREILTELTPDASDSQLRAVLEEVDLWRLIDALPGGLDAPMDEAGMRISGGQRTRLLLARALVSKRPVLMLDEPLANIDTASRRIISRQLGIAKRTRILIVVTHDQDFLEIADHVICTADFLQAEVAPVVPASICSI